MNCKEIKETLFLAGTGELDAAAERGLEDHLKSCPGCRQEAALQKRLIGSLPRPPRLSDAYWDAYTQKILDRLEGNAARRPAPAWRWAAAFALGVILIGGTTFSFRKIQEKKKTEEVVANLEVLENLNLLASEDFDKWSVQ